MVKKRKVMGSSGFTLIEVMIIICIIGILASIAIPNYKKYLIQAKAAQVMENINSIRSAVGAKFSETGYVKIEYPGRGATLGNAPLGFQEVLPDSMFNALDGTLRIGLMSSNFTKLNATEVAMGMQLGEPYLVMLATKGEAKHVLAAIHQMAAGKLHFSGGAHNLATYALMR